MTSGRGSSASGRPVGFGFLGAGWVAGRAVAPAVHAADGAVLQAVAARDVARASALEPAGRVHARYEDLLADPDVDVVYVNLTNEAHLRWTLAALEAGKHVLCEKPLGLTPQEVATMRAAATSGDRLLVEALWYRWHPRMRRLTELVASGAFGALRSVHAAFCFQGDFTGEFAATYRLDPARGGGALYDVGCYALSGVHAVVEAAGVAGQPQLGLVSGTIGETGVDTVVGADLEWPQAVRATVRCGIAAPDEQALHVVGTQARVDCGAGEAFTAWRGPSSLAIEEGHTRREEWFEPVDAYVLMVQAVAAAVRGEEAFLPGLDHTAAVAAAGARIRERLDGPEPPGAKDD